MYSTATAKSSIDLKLYKGVVLVGKRVTIDMPWEPVGSYAYAFRKKDSIWTEIYMSNVLESYSILDTLK